MKRNVSYKKLTFFNGMINFTIGKAKDSHDFKGFIWLPTGIFWKMPAYIIRPAFLMEG